jgi:hypothetical protein
MDHQQESDETDVESQPGILPVQKLRTNVRLRGAAVRQKLG